MHLFTQALKMRVNIGDVKQRVMKSERGIILTAMKTMICMSVSRKLATTIVAQVIQSYFVGFDPALTLSTIEKTPKITT